MKIRTCTRRTASCAWLMVEAQFGSEVCTTLSVPYRIQKPTLNDIVQGVKRQTQILYPRTWLHLHASRRGPNPHGH